MQVCWESFKNMVLKFFPQMIFPLNLDFRHRLSFSKELRWRIWMQIPHLWPASDFVDFFAAWVLLYSCHLQMQTSRPSESYRYIIHWLNYKNRFFSLEYRFSKCKSSLTFFLPLCINIFSWFSAQDAYLKNNHFIEW